MSRNHPYRSLQVPSDAPFVLKPSPGKGWGVFATKPIEQGAMILRENPLFVIRKPHEWITEEDVWTAFQSLLPRGKQQFLCLRDNASNPFTSMSEAFAENSFAQSSSIHGLYLLHSRFNHSCLPNSKIPTTTDGPAIACFATKDIAPDEEITFCYNTDFECRARSERHGALRFTCDCKACLIGTPFQQLSDLRRRFIRGLQYLTLGVDLGGQRQDSVSPIIIDPELKKAAENFSIPLSARLIYDVLVAYLLEEEGLLDHFMVKRLEPGIVRTVASFETEGNVEIARLAIVQETWLEKLCTAFRLYGRADTADHAVAVGLRMLYGRSRNP
ncbi:hypothetical protein BP5796_12041 [Coleophoma crateriformis]|uniref:SET domain-containing protein n=1 Tax=Coleophoma crateriformis TaxID=565419 RepID=A0A3D8QBN2_9HELO|nr:hypothetical protein BP5796_12041 [Coleophoma crateriformis]